MSIVKRHYSSVFFLVTAALGLSLYLVSCGQPYCIAGFGTGCGITPSQSTSSNSTTITVTISPTTPLGLNNTATVTISGNGTQPFTIANQNPPQPTGGTFSQNGGPLNYVYTSPSSIPGNGSQMTVTFNVTDANGNVSPQQTITVHQ